MQISEKSILEHLAKCNYWDKYTAIKTAYIDTFKYANKKLHILKDYELNINCLTPLETTPFFDYQVRKLIKGHIQERNSQKILLYTLDCCLSKDIEDNIFNLGKINDPIFLPKIGIQLNKTEGECIIKIDRKNIIVYDTKNANKKTIFTFYKKKNYWEKINSSLIYTYCQDIDYFDNTSFIYLSKENNELKDLRSKIKLSLQLIKNFNLHLFEAIINNIKFIIPIKTENISIHQSFSRHDLPGVIFISNGSSALEIAEAIIHEYHHNELNVAMYFDKFILNENSQYYSPWKNEPRPLYGLIHAIYVFTEIVRFHMLINNCESLKNYQIHISSSSIINTIVVNNLGKIILGIAQINNKDLTNLGIQLIIDIKNHLKSINKNLKVQAFIYLKKYLIDHTYKIYSKYPSLHLVDFNYLADLYSELIV